jgi:hypothetical protein
MRDRSVHGRRVTATLRLAPIVVSGWFLLAATPLFGQVPATVTVGGGLQTSYVHTSPDGGDDTDAFPLNSIRLYVNGQAADKIKFMFNTEYDGRLVGILDAVAQIEFSPQFNIWAGRFLPPTDRANLYGPYFANHWLVYTDGVQDGYPFVSPPNGGRMNGAMYWGQFAKVKVSAGAFDGESADGDSTVIGSGRVQVDFWDQEAGYYLNGTYYGDKNLLAIGAAGMVQGKDANDETKSAWSVDFLLEKKLGPSGGTVSVESEYAMYNQLGGYNSKYATDKGGYVLGAYLFPKKTGMGQIQLLGKFAKANFTNGVSIFDKDYDQKTTEINLNYIIKQFNARVMIFFQNTTFSAVKPDFKRFGVGIQLQI